MFKFAIFCVNGFKGAGYYNTQAEALRAARLRTNLTGISWYVSAVKVG